MPKATTSLRAEQSDVRLRMRALGLSYDEIAAEFARRYRLRPRAAWRLAYGWTFKQAADQINSYAGHAGLDPTGRAGMTGPHLCEYEKWPAQGGRKPTPQVLALLARVYDTDIHALLDLEDLECLTPTDRLLVNRPSNATRATASHSFDAKTKIPPRGNEILGSTTAVARRMETRRIEGLDTIKETPKARLPPESLTAIPMARSHRIGPDVPVRLRERTARLRRLDNVLGGGDTYGIYLAEYQATDTLLRAGGYAEVISQALLSVLAEQAQQAGWAAFDAGNGAEAMKLFETSRQAAIEAGDGLLIGNALAFLAYQACGTDHRKAVQIANESCRTVRGDAAPKVRALLYERLAWAHAVAGSVSDTERALGVAQAALAENDGTQPPDWAAWVDQEELQIMTGRCWTELRRPLRAVPMLEEVLGRFDETRARDKALYLSWLADAYLTAGEIEQAATVTGRALDLAAGIASVRPHQRIRAILHQLGGHRELPQVAETLQKARALTQAGRSGSVV